MNKSQVVIYIFLFPCLFLFLVLELIFASLTSKVMMENQLILECWFISWNFVVFCEGFLSRTSCLVDKLTIFIIGWIRYKTPFMSILSTTWCNNIFIFFHKLDISMYVCIMYALIMYVCILALILLISKNIV